MAGIQLLDVNGKPIGGKESARQPHQISVEPGGGNWYLYSGFTGTIDAALAANSEVLQFRFLAATKTFALVHRVMFDGLGIVTVPVADGPLGFALFPARAWTTAGSGGTRISVADNLRMETAIGTSQVNDLGIATTGALTAGTKTKYANAQGQALGGISTAVLTGYGPSCVIAPQPLLDCVGGGMPLVLANQEGFVIQTTHVGPAGLTYVAGFTVLWREVSAF